MYNSHNDDIFDAILTTAFHMYWDKELASMPSDEELAEMYPVPQKQVRQMQRYAKRLEYNTPIAIVYLRRFAVVCLVILSLTFAVFATSPTVREAIKDTVVTWYEKYVKFDFAKSDNTESEITDIYELNIGYIPDGFEIVSSTEESDIREYLYVANNGDYILLSICTSHTTGYAADIELQDYEIFSYNNREVYLLYSDVERSGTLICGNSFFNIRITAIIEKSEIIKIFEYIG